LKKLAHGGSIAVDGTCLTVVSKTADSFSADIMPETVERTTLGKMKRDDEVNLELPATPTTFLSGHVVQGHVDGIGKVKNIRARGTSHIVEIAVPRALMPYIVPKGSVAVNGVSLTVISVSASGFTVGIIPHTWEETAFSHLSPGSQVNIETDVFAKYAEKLIKAKKKS